ncbi:MAG: matrixin family metalloprotease [Planctomycetota bacterium]
MCAPGGRRLAYHRRQLASRLAIFAGAFFLGSGFLGLGLTPSALAISVVPPGSTAFDGAHSCACVGTCTCGFCSHYAGGIHNHGSTGTGSPGSGAVGSSAFTFNDNSRWSATATDGGGLGQGDPTTLTWSFLPDGTAISNQGVPGESSDPSSLIATLDNNFNVPVVDRISDLTQRPWFTVFESSFNRFAELSGLSYRYEPNDDGNANGGINNTSFPFGQTNVRGDVRIGGHSIDGGSGPNVLAYNYFPEHGDMVLDTDNTSQFSSNNLRFRNIVMHEHGHGLGFAHVEPVTQTKLMEPFLSVQFEGPQIDDIQALHRGYGDFFEKSNSGQGNETFALATPLGIVSDSTTSIGADGGETGSAFEVFPGETDFISIDDNSDIDFLSFTLTSLSRVDLTLTPVGGSYASRPQDGNNNNNGDNTPIIDFTARSDLRFSLFDTDGTTPIGGVVNNGGLGDAESLTSLMLGPGTYFTEIRGAANTVQLYQFDVSAISVPEPTTLVLGMLAFAAIAYRRPRA